MFDSYTTHTGDIIELPKAYCSQHQDAEAPSNIDGSSPLTIRASRTSPTLSNTERSTVPVRLTRISPSLNIPNRKSTVDPIAALVSGFTSPETNRRSSCGSTNPLIEIVGPDELPKRAPATPPRLPPQPSVEYLLSRKKQTGKRSLGKKGNIQSVANLTTVSMVYNQYGELVEERELHVSPKSEDLNVTQLLRVIRKAYHHELRDKVGKIITPRPDGKASVLVDDGIWKDRLSSWDFKHAPRSPKAQEDIPSETHSVAVYHGPPRVLEIGCGDGMWCFGFKKEQPDWFVEGVDDTNHWSCIDREIEPEDFMVPNPEADPAHLGDFFSLVHTSQKAPEFTLRDPNSLLAHSKPIPHNLYEFIRAREIFDRIESYKTFLDDIRSLLKPDGVVEFLEIDPRPRIFSGIQKKDENEKADRHKSIPQTDWTDNIADRFKNPLDAELATTVPGWTERVAERLKATMAPRDGVAAACLKSWFQGAGFWDVKQIVLPIPVGGNTRSGQLMKEYVLYQTELENCIPKLCEELPAVEISEIASGAYFMNLHIVTGRKPYEPRPGDLLIDGSRQEMTASKYHAMARHHDSKTSQWKRYDLQGKLTTMMQSLTTLTGAPTSLNESPTHLVYGGADTKDPFKSPPFVPEQQTPDEVRKKTSSSMMKAKQSRSE
ncbi:hypothetical protein LZ554_007135 [Drepanopeziza brunnea f. sp. 'monogermtubi']|nr:hypothetical protein LZ554_007135 [Drepanopeziza brunnea f. sp. 'monogermtubi']